MAKSMDKKSLLERTALGFSVVVLLTAVGFWILQIGDVLETLRLAYG